MQKHALRRVQQEGGSGGTADQTGQRHGPGQVQVFADVFAIGGNGGELAGPQSHGVGGVGLNRQDPHAEDGRKEEKRSSARHGVEAAAEEGGHNEPDPVPVQG